MYRIERTTDGGKTWQKVFQSLILTTIVAQFCVLVNNRDFSKGEKFRAVKQVGNDLTIFGF